MTESFTKCYLDTCTGDHTTGCCFTMKFTPQEDGSLAESLHVFHSKCAEHAALSDQDAFDAALTKARALNTPEG